jgi:hypothetical protein
MWETDIEQVFEIFWTSLLFEHDSSVRVQISGVNIWSLVFDETALYFACKAQDEGFFIVVFWLYIPYLN